MSSEIKIQTTTEDSIHSSFESKIHFNSETTFLQVLKLIKSHLKQMGIDEDIVDFHIMTPEDGEDEEDYDEKDNPFSDDFRVNSEGTLKDRFLSSSELSDEALKRRNMIEKKIEVPSDREAFLKSLEANPELLKQVFLLFLEETI